jgi:hypothetical protein
MRKALSHRANKFDETTWLKRKNRPAGHGARSICSAAFETLENRTMMSTSVASSNSVTLANGILYVTGNPTLACSLTANLANNGTAIHASADNSHALTVALSSVKSIQITGGSAADYIYVDQNIKLPVTISGGGGNDAVRGGGGKNTIYEGSGNNWISARGTTNYVQVGDGNNVVLGANGNDTIIAGNGNDSLDGAGGNDSITAGNGNDTITGDAGNDTITTGNGRDSVNGGLDNDVLKVGTGADTVVPGSGTNSITRGSTLATIVPSAGTNTVVTLGGTTSGGTTGGTGGTTSGGSTGGSTSGGTTGGTTSGGTTGGTTTGGNTGGNTGGTTSGGTTSGGTTSGSGNPTVGQSNNWTTYSAGAASGTAPRAIMQVLAPAATVGISVVTRALNSTLGYGSQIDANYQWNFGDAGSEYNTLAGFNAAHVYTTPGTYMITLTVTNALRQTSTVSASIAISADTRRVIYVNTNGSDNNNGLSQSSPIQSAAKADSMVSNNTEILFARGETFNLGQAFKLGYHNVLVGAYGTGAQPVINYTAPATGAVIFTTNTPAAAGVTVEDLTMTTLNGTQPTNTKMPMGVMAGGTDTSVLRCTFDYVEYDVNASAAPVGLTVEDSTSPINGGLQGYFIWDEGTDTTALGNYVNGSVHEHVMRTSGAYEMLIADNDFNNYDGKGGIEIHVGGSAWIDGNTVNQGDIRVGPLGLWGEPITDSTTLCVIQNNHVNNTDIAVFPGAHDISIRNNIITRPDKELMDIQGQDGLGRQSADIRILNNTGFLTGTTGDMVKIENHTNAVLLENNLLIAPNMAVGGFTTAPVYVNDSSLSDFTYISGNVWQEPGKFYWTAYGGINYVGYATTPKAYQTPAAWNSLAQVGTDYFSATPISSVDAPAAGSLASNVGVPVQGVFTNIYGTPRPAAGPWTAGAV